MKTIITIATLFMIIGCTNSQIKNKKTTLHNSSIKMPSNIISVKECTSKGGKVWNTLGETSYNGKLIGTLKGLRCPCACLIEP